jgi:hypothetical protein
MSHGEFVPVRDNSNFSSDNRAQVHQDEDVKMGADRERSGEASRFPCILTQRDGPSPLISWREVRVHGCELDLELSLQAAGEIILRTPTEPFHFTAVNLHLALDRDKLSKDVADRGGFLTSVRFL